MFGLGAPARGGRQRTAAATRAGTHEKLGNVFGAVRVMLNAFLRQERPPRGPDPDDREPGGQGPQGGLVSLEGEDIPDTFMARGVRLGVDGLSPDVVKTTLLSELVALARRHQRGQKIFRFMGATAPAMGMIGTLIGLVQMLRTLDNPSAIGPAMAVALLTTLYGAILVFLIFNPVAEKLENRTTEEVARKMLAITGVESILRGDNTLVIQSKLESLLNPKEREKSEAGRS